MTCLLNSWLRPKYGKTLLRRRRVRPGLRLERLEDRWVPAQTFTVQNEAQLVIAITKSNTDAVNGSTDFDNPDIIQFAVPGPGTPTITLTADLPANSGFLSIQGASQAGVTINGNGFRVFVNTNKLIIDSLTITGGLAPAGAGGGAINSTNFLILSNSALTSNTSAAQGGGLANSGTALVINCTFTNNHAVSGGGVANSGETLVIENSTIAGNTATTGNGGGLANTGNAAVINATFHGNQAPYGSGGALWSNEFVQLEACTIAANSAAETGGIFNDVGHAILRDSIAYGNTNGDVFSSSELGEPGTAATTRYDHCVIGSVDSNDSANNLFDDGDNLGVDPLLGPLQNNGGPTPTMALGEGSPAIGKGNVDAIDPATDGPITTDQRGYPRAGTAPDIGAFQTLIRVLDQNSLAATLAANGSVSLQTRPADSGALFDLVRQLTAGTVNIELTTGTYTEFQAFGGTGVVNLPNGLSVHMSAHGSVTIVGGSPALRLDSGTMSVDGVTFTTGTGDPTILVNGGSLKLRNDTILESDQFARAAIQVAASGTLDLGSESDSGNNNFIIRGPGSALAVAPGAEVTEFGNFSNVSAQATLTLNTADLSATYDGTPHAVGVTTDPFWLNNVTVTYQDANDPNATPSTTPPTTAGTYDVVATLNSSFYTAGSATGTLTITAPAGQTVTITAGQKYTYTDANGKSITVQLGAGGSAKAKLTFQATPGNLTSLDVTGASGNDLTVTTPFGTTTSIGSVTITGSSMRDVNLATVTVGGFSCGVPIHDLKVGAVRGTFTLTGGGNDAILGAIGTTTATATVVLGGGFDDVIFGGVLAGSSFTLLGNADDVLFGIVASGASVSLGTSTQVASLHNFVGGIIQGNLFVYDTFHDGTVGLIVGGHVFLRSIGHQFTTASKAVGWNGLDLSLEGGGHIVLGSSADKSKVKTR